MVQRFLLMRESGVARFPLSQIKPSFQGEQRPKFSKQRRVIPIKVVIEKILAKVKKGEKVQILKQTIHAASISGTSLCTYFMNNDDSISIGQFGIHALAH